MASTRQGYEYRPNSNLVLNLGSDRKRDSNVTSSEPTTLWNKMSGAKFGDRAHQDKPKDLQDKLSRSKKKKQKRSQLKEAQKVQKMEAGGSVLQYDEQEGLRYQPKTKETRMHYEHILTSCQTFLGDVPQDVLRGAVDEIIALLKTDGMSAPDRQKECSDILGKQIADEVFNKMVNSGKGLTDFNLYGDEEKEEEQMDEDMGVTVLMDSDSEDSQSDLDEVEDAVDPDDADETKVDTAADVTLEADDVEMDAVDDDIKKDKDYVDLDDIDAYWLQRTVCAKHHSDANDAQKEAADIMTLLQARTDDRVCENKLVQLLKYQRFSEIRLLLKNRWKVVVKSKLSAAQSDEARNTLEEEMMGDDNQKQVVIQLRDSRENVGDRSKAREFEQTLKREALKLRREQQLGDGSRVSSGSAYKVVDLEAIQFNQGGHFMSNKELTLPEGSFRTVNKEGGYEQVVVPATKKAVPKEGQKKVAIESIPEWAQPAFKGITHLNAMQSQCYKTAMLTPDNLLLCAPTAAGKTNVAMLTMLHEIGKARSSSGHLNLDAFKIVYIAPMKALVQEVVGNFNKRLGPYGITVNELTGDSQLSKQQISETQIIVTTPEKWDIITRKSGDRTYTSLVKLIIIDEIHLLHDTRGPVLEAIVARMIRQIETTQEMIRLVGLSATLPNYADVAAFLRVKPDKGLFVFDYSYRPVGLEQTYIGITEKKALKRHQVMNDLTYEKVLEQQAGENPQVLVFVHSRKDTAKTARALMEQALENDTLGRFLKEDSVSREILATEAETAQSSDLKELLPYGFAIHHAGLSQSDRRLVEDLYADAHIPVLVSTATLAWGVNLPAHTVIIKGTQVYSPEKCGWVELSFMDIMQMMGRAGRPQYDTKGEGIVITTHQELHYYLSLLNQQLPVESQMITKLADMLLAEVVLGTISTVKEGVDWIGYTYLYMRMLRNPSLYGASNVEMEKDRLLEKRRADLIHTAAATLDKQNLIRYDHRSGKFQVTELGRVASHYYVDHETMGTFNEHLKPTMSDIDLFRLFSLAGEFKYMRVREEEKMELHKLLERVPIPVKESMEEPSAKCNVLLQAYISGLKLEGLALVSDMVYVTQSAGRLIRALFEICLKRGWAALTDKVLSLCKMVDRRMWGSQSPLRQFKGFPEETIRKLEKKNFEFNRLYDLNPQELGELVRVPKLGKKLHHMVAQFPKLELAGHVQPITRSILRVELTITPDFLMDEKTASTEPFWILVEDVDSEVILHHETFLLKPKYSRDEHTVTFFVPLMEPLPPQYFVRVVSDRWIAAEAVLPISFRHLILPEKYPPHTELLDLQPLPVSALRNSSYESLYSDWKTFNPIQTQVFMTLYNTDDNVLVAAPTGSGKTVCAEFAMLRTLSAKAEAGGKARIVYVAPLADIAAVALADISEKFGKGLGRKVGELTGETSTDLKVLEQCEIIVSTAEHWDMMSRRWKQRRNVQNVDLMIVDELHLVGADKGPTLEVVVSRMRNVAGQTEKPIRIVGLSTSLANAKDLGEWIGASSAGIFNFHPNVRPLPLEIHLRGFDIQNYASRMLSMAKPVYSAITQHCLDDEDSEKVLPAMVIVSSRRLARVTAVDMLTYAAGDGDPAKFLQCDQADVEPHVEKMKDSTLKHCCMHGVGYLHPGMAEKDKAVVELLYTTGALQLVVWEHSMCWQLTIKAHLVVIMDTQYYHGREHRYTDYSVSKMLQMMGFANRPLQDDCGKCVVMCLGSKKAFFKKFLFEPLPCESHLDHALGDHLCAEVITKTVENKQDAVDYLTWTFLYRRLTQNPNYYNLQGVSYRHLSDHLSELVEETLTVLETSRAIAIKDDMDLSALNLGMIASYYYIETSTVELFASSLTERTKLKGLLEILCAAVEFESVPIRHNEDRVLRQLAGHLPLKIDNPKYTEPSTKVNVLLQAHFSRQSLKVPSSATLTAELEEDQQLVLSMALRLLFAMVDVISSSGWLSPALACMEMSQMIVQGMWDRDSVFLQLPHVTKKIAEGLEKKELQGIFDIMELEDEDRNELLPLKPAQMAQVANWCNRYPNIDLTFEVEDADDIAAGDPVTVVVDLQRDLDEDSDDEDGDKDMDGDDKAKAPLEPVMAGRYPKRKDEGWWLVIGDTKSRKLMSVKRVPLQHAAKVKLEFEAPDDMGKYKFLLYFMCDSYMGCDQEYEINVDVKEGQSSEEEDSDEDEE